MEEMINITTDTSLLKISTVPEAMKSSSLNENKRLVSKLSKNEDFVTKLGFLIWVFYCSLQHKSPTCICIFIDLNL